MLVSEGQVAFYHKKCRKLRSQRSIIKKSLTKKKGNKTMSDEEKVEGGEQAAETPASDVATEAPASEEKSE
jgi:hypothetical protein